MLHVCVYEYVYNVYINAYFKCLRVYINVYMIHTCVYIKDYMNIEKNIKLIRQALNILSRKPRMRCKKLM
jgi:hypothetical protein